MFTFVCLYIILLISLKYFKQGLREKERQNMIHEYVTSFCIKNTQSNRSKSFNDNWCKMKYILEESLNKSDKV